MLGFASSYKTEPFKGKQQSSNQHDHCPKGPKRDSFAERPKAALQREKRTTRNNGTIALGIDINKYHARSSRAALTFSCQAKGRSLAEIMKSAGWSNSINLARFYDKPVDTTSANFGCMLNPDTPCSVKKYVLFLCMRINITYCYELFVMQDFEVLGDSVVTWTDDKVELPD